MDFTSPFTEGLVLLASLGFLVAIYYAYRLWSETKGEKYWVLFLLSALAMGAREWAVIPVELHWIPRSSGIMVEEVAAIIGGFTFAYASFGLYAAMRKIREHMQKNAGKGKAQ